MVALSKYFHFFWATFQNQIVSIKLDASLFLSGHRKRNDWALFNSKKIVLIGPAEEYNAELEEALLQCDIIVLVNKGYRVPHYDKFRSFGKKIVLFHCLDETEVGGCGCLNKEELVAKGITDIFYPLNENHLAHNVLAFLKKHKADFNLYWIDKGVYKLLKNGIFGFVPNTGFAALFGIHYSGCEWVYVHGLTFHRTSYLANYGNDGLDLNRNINFIERYGNHNPDKDWLYFLNILQSGRVRLSPLLTTFVNGSSKNKFYLTPIESGDLVSICARFVIKILGRLLVMVNKLIEVLGVQTRYFFVPSSFRSGTDSPLVYKPILEANRIYYEEQSVRFRISGVFRVRNCESTIYQSLLSYSRICSELIVVDNNSEDGTINTINKFIADFPRVDCKIFHYPHKIESYGCGYRDRVLENPNGSIARFYNYSFSLASGDYLLKCDAGCLLLPGSFIKLFQILRQDYDVVFTNGIEINGRYIGNEPRLFKRTHLNYVDGDNYEFLNYDESSRVARLDYAMFIHTRDV